MYSLIALAALSFVLSFLLTPLVSWLCIRWNVVDRPGDRKVHRGLVPRAGGVAVVLSYLLACSVLPLTPARAGDLIWSSRDQILHLLPAFALIFLLGFVDDIRGLTAAPKLICETAAALYAYMAGAHLTTIAGHPLPMWLSLPMTVFWLLACTNAVNLIDGLDGLACGVGLFATATTLVAALLQHNVTLALGVVPLFGALLAFLRYNQNPATIFLGDSGSLFVGFLLGCFGVLWTTKSTTLLGMTAPLMAFALPLLDTSLSIVRRFLANKPIFSADRGHIHHRLLDRGLAPRRVANLLYLCCGVGAFCAVGVMNAQTELAAMVVFAALIWFGLNRLGYMEFDIAAHLLNPTAFRRTLSARMRLAALEKTLVSAPDAEACWVAVRDASRDLGFIHIAVRLDHALREERFPAICQSGRTWTLRIPLSANGFVNVSHHFQSSAASAVMSSFADLIHRTLEPRMRDFTEQSTSTDKLALGSIRYAGV